MRYFRRASVWIALLGLATTLIIVFQQRSGEPAATRDAAGGAEKAEHGHAVDGASKEPTAVVPAASPAGYGDESDSKCVQIIRDAADFATKEANVRPVDAAETDEEAKAAEQELAEARRRLAASNDPEPFLTAMLLGSVETRASSSAAQARLVELADHALKAGSKVLAFHALSACTAAKQSCPIAHLEQRLLDLDRQNAESWALVATRRFERNDMAGALAAMQQAARAPTSTWYWTETVALIERSLAAQSTMSYARRTGNAFGSAAAALPPLDSFKMCKAESAASRAWAEACLAFGKLQTDRNETESARSISFAMREQILTALGDRQAATEVAAELAHVRAERSAMGQGEAMAMQMLQWSLIQTDPAQMQAYLGAVQQFGESEGRRVFLRRQLPPVLERSGLLKRDGARECMARFFAGIPRATAGQQAQAADELYISIRTQSNGNNWTLRIQADGRIDLPRLSRARNPDGTEAPSTFEVDVAGKTTAEIQREIATQLAPYYRSPEVAVTLLARRSDEALRREFDIALHDAAGRRSSSRQ